MDLKTVAMDGTQSVVSRPHRPGKTLYWSPDSRSSASTQESRRTTLEPTRPPSTGQPSSTRNQYSRCRLKRRRGEAMVQVLNLCSNRLLQKSELMKRGGQYISSVWARPIRASGGWIKSPSPSSSRNTHSPVFFFWPPSAYKVYVCK